MIKIENVEVYGWEAAIRGMRNPLNSWGKSDTEFEYAYGAMHSFKIGENDLKLMKNLSKAGNDHGKFLRFITVTADITAPQFWWFEFDTYKVGTVKNSCSKMHKIHVKPFSINDFSHEGIDEVNDKSNKLLPFFQEYLDKIEWLRMQFNSTQEKKYWRALIEMLPSGYNMRATVFINYQVAKAQYEGRHNHKLTEWIEYCEWLKTLPYFEEVCLC